MEFPGFNKISRLYREVYITEKIDGTNGLIEIVEFPLPDLLFDGFDFSYNEDNGYSYVINPDDNKVYTIRAGSRNRWLTATKKGDNFGFAGWVRDNAETLVFLGPGNHYGEWFGAGIQRGYGLDKKYFALFNPKPYVTFLDSGAFLETLCVVPTIIIGILSDSLIQAALMSLDVGGSLVAQMLGVQEPQEAEGIIVQHSQNLVRFKVLSQNDDMSKTEVSRRVPAGTKIKVKNTGAAVATGGGVANSGLIIGGFEVG